MSMHLALDRQSDATEAFLNRPSISIRLDHNDAFYTDSTILGDLELNFARPQVVRFIAVKLECVENTKDNGVRFDCQSSSRWRFWNAAGQHVVFSNEVVIYNYDKSNPLTVVGKNIFAFTVYLPKDLPPSFDFPFGSITYKLVADCQLQLFDRLEAEHEIDVISPLHRVYKPLSIERGILVNKCPNFWKKNNIWLKVDMTADCWVPGEMVNLKVDVKNFSNRKIQYLRVKFFKVIQVKMTKPFRELGTNSEIMFDFISKGFKGKTQTIYNIKFRMPEDFPVFNFSKCFLFKTFYQFLIRCHTSCRNLDAKLKVHMVTTKWNKEMSGDHDKSQYILPLDQPIVTLDADEAFKNLSLTEKLYAHYISRASWYGSLITYLQTSVESAPLFVMLHTLFSSQNPGRFKQEALNAGFTEDEINALFVYACGIFTNAGNYKGFGDSKFIPGIPADRLEELLKLSPAWNEINPIWQKYQSRIYDLSPGKTCLGYPPDGCNTYMSKNCTAADNEIIKDWMKQNKLEGYNTRLFKTQLPDAIKYEIRLASVVEDVVKEDVVENVTFTLKLGDYSRIMPKVVDKLKTASQYAANGTQADMLMAYADSFMNGSLDDHKMGSRYWITDKQPTVETYIGFIETYRDPAGIRGEFESFVAIVNKEMSRKFTELVNQAENLLELLPWPKEFEKDVFLRPDFTSLDVLTFASSGIPAGINIPNYDDIRQTEGFKNVSLGNVIPASYQMSSTPFLSKSDSELMQKYRVPAFELQVGLHELLGHGSGKMFQKNEMGVTNFSHDLKNPLNDDTISSHYKQGDTFDSIFGSMGSSYEECRAEAVGLYLSLVPEVLTIFGHEGEQADDITYVNWLSLIWNGIGKALETWDPHRGWLQAHCQARYVLARVLIEAGVVKVTEPSEDDMLVTLDRDLLPTVGKKAIGDFLLKLQVFKSTAYVKGAKRMYDEYSTVDGPWLNRRKIVLANKQPRKMFIQGNTVRSGQDVLMTTYSESPEGLIQSWVDRFKCPKLLYDALLRLTEQDEHHFL